MNMYEIREYRSLQRSIRKGFLAAAFFLGLLVSPLVHAHGLPANKPAQNLSAEDKTQLGELARQIQRLLADYKTASGASKTSTLVSKMSPLALDRQQRLFNLIEKDPAFVAGMAMPDSTLAGMPEAVRNLFEQTEDIEGELKVFHIDDRDAKNSRYEYFLDTPSGQHLSLHFAANPPSLVSGTKLRAHGKVFIRSGTHNSDETDAAMLVDSGATGLLILAKGNPNGGGNTSSSGSGSSTINTLGEHRTLVILVNFQDN